MTRALRLCLAFLISFFLTWEMVQLGLSLAYTYSLLHPPCTPGLQEIEGFQSVTIPVADGSNLTAWYYPPENGALILMMGGNGAGRDALLAEGQMLASHGFGSLLAGSRSCAGGMTTLGFRETQDFLGMLDFAVAQSGVERIGALGFSVGGASAIRAAVRDERIEAVIAEGQYASLQGEFTDSDSFPFSMQWQMEQFTSLFYELITEVSPRELDTIAELGQISPRPVLLIFGENEADNARALDQFAAAGEPRQIWILPGVGHGGYFIAEPLEYESRVVEFFENALLR